jgi:hypothetical protein
MLTELIQEVGLLSVGARIVLIIVVAGFMPLSAMTFFFSIYDRKEKEYKKAVEDMGRNAKGKTISDAFPWTAYILPVTFVSLICFLAITYMLFLHHRADNLPQTLLLAGVDFGLDDAEPAVRRSVIAVSFAFLGSFIWSATNIIRRLINFDLSPNVYYSAGIRIILSATVAVVLAFLLGDIVNAALPSLALIAGMFPERVINYLIVRYKEIIGGRWQALEEEIALENVQGISMQHRERLSELAIDNAQNLATYNYFDLLKKTPFETREVLDWMGQAKLLVYVRKDIDFYRNLGIRSVFDFLQGDKTQEELKAMVAAAGGDEKQKIMISNVFEQVVADDGIQNLFLFHQNMNRPTDKKERLD